MSDQTAPAASPLPEIGTVTLMELRASILEGWRDFRRAPAFGLFFAAFYVVGGYVLYLAIFASGQIYWTMPVTLAFPLIGPFAAVGLYETSRRLEAGIPLKWGEILSVVIAEKDRQIPWMGAVMVIWLLFWMFLAHMIFALFLGLSAMTNISHSLDVLWTPDGLKMIAVEIIVGAAFAWVLFSATVVSLPLMLEREVDFVSAMLLSFRTVGKNRLVMLVWAAIVVIFVAIGFAPAFLGLFVTLPVIGHATWHLYRRALYDPV